MFVKKITYEDFNGVERTEDHYFHLSKTEFLKFLVTNGEYTIDQQLEMLTKKGRGKDVIEIIEHLVDISYGQKSLDGKRFEKSPEILKEFKETDAYSEYFFELVTNADEAAKFIAGILPAKMMEDARKTLKENPDSVPAEIRQYIAK